MSIEYTVEEGKLVQQMLRDIATLRDHHSILAPQLASATDDLKYCLEFIANMVKKQEKS